MNLSQFQLEDVVARETRDEETSTPHPQILDNSTGISIEMRDKAQETSRSLIDLQDKQTSYEVDMIDFISLLNLRFIAFC